MIKFHDKMLMFESSSRTYKILCTIFQLFWQDNKYFKENVQMMGIMTLAAVWGWEELEMGGAKQSLPKQLHALHRQVRFFYFKE